MHCSDYKQWDFSGRVHGGAQRALSVLSSLCLTLPPPWAGSHDRKLLNLFIHTCLILILHTDSACGFKKMDERSQGHEGVRVMMSLDLINYITQHTSHSKGTPIEDSGWVQENQLDEMNWFFLELTSHIKRKLFEMFFLEPNIPTC